MNSQTNKFKDTYRIPSARASWWNYGWNGFYFVTICTQNRVHYFGEIKNGKMHLSSIGKWAQSCWMEIPQHFPFVKLGAFVVMPNHVHGIIGIDKKPAESPISVPNPSPSPQNISSFQSSSPPHPPQPQRTQPQPPSTKNKFGPQSQNLGSIVRGFKIGVTKNARLINAGFALQPRYHDNIIRNQKAYNNISRYIQNNPRNWMEDRFHSEQ